jgi:integrase
VKQLAPSTINGYRTALAGALKHKLNLGNDKELSALIHSFYQEKPRIRHSIPAWDLALVLSCLKSEPFEPLGSCDLKWLTLKTVFLTMLASGKRRGEIHALDFSNFKHHEKWLTVTLTPHVGFISKTGLKKLGAHVLDSFTIPALVPSLSPSLSEERTLCPVRALKYYLGRTKDMRLGKKLLFVSHAKQHKTDICKNTISGWVRSLIVKAHEDVPDTFQSLVTPRTHEVRALAASLAFRGNIDVEEMLQACSWKNHSTFSSFYLRDVSHVQGQLRVLGPIVAAQAVINPTAGGD